MSVAVKTHRIKERVITIKEVTDEHILFSDGSRITFDHVQDCCEHNYANFESLDDIARNATFYGGSMVFRMTEHGFTFSDGVKLREYFVPCYSEQNGYYTNDVTIYYTDCNGRTLTIFTVEGEWIDY